MARLLAIALTIALTSSVTLAQPDSRRIGILYPDNTEDRHLAEILVRELGKLGRVEGQNLTIDYRWTTAGGRDQPAMARNVADLVALGVDMVATTSFSQVDAVLQHSEVPVVFCRHSNPVVMGHAASLARPGGRATGISAMAEDLLEKRFQLLKELMPEASKLAMVTSGGPPTEPGKRSLKILGARLGFELYVSDMPVHTIDNYEAAFLKMSRDGVAGFWTGSNAYQNRDLGVRVAELAVKYRMAGVSSFREWPEVGGLMSYGPDQESMHERCAWYVDQVLRGADPAEMPVERPSGFNLVVNKKTMEALGLTPSPKLQFAITELIE